MPALSRKQIGNIYRPQGPKVIVQGLPWASGGQQVVSGAQVDLSVPIEGFRLVFKLRDVLAANAMTTANPLGYLNLIKRIYIFGKNSRQGGNATLWDIDLASIALMLASVIKKPFIYNGVSAAGAPSAGTEAASDAFGTPVTGLFNGAIGTYDIRIAIDLPAYPFETVPYLRPGYMIRSQEWQDTLQIRLEFATIVNGTTHALGTDNAASTHTFTSFGSGAGTPTVDLYALPSIMGADLDAVHQPGFLSRVSIPVASILQSAGGINTRLLTMEKQDTTRVWAIVGTSTVAPAFATLSDANLTTLGMLIGGNKVVRENDDIHAHKMDACRRYGVQPIQGVTLFDFNPGLNPDAKYNAGDAGEGAVLELRGTVAGVANAQGLFIQETERYQPEGALYSA